MARKSSSHFPRNSLAPSDCAWIGLAAATLLFSFILTAPEVAADQQKPKSAQPAVLSQAFKGRLPITELTEEEATLHALNRLGFGPRPGDVERIRRMGLEKWIEQQLNPASLDDAAVARRLERFPTLAMSPAKLLQEFPTPEMAARRAGISPEEYRKQREQMAREREERQRMREQRQMESGDPGERIENRPRQLLGSGDPNNVPLRFDQIRTPQRIIGELGMAKLTRAISSERQLNEVMVDFWFNHFNVFAPKGADRWLTTSFEHDVIRPRVLGKFKDLLHATAASPAMLFYLDNWMSADPKAAEKMQREITERRQRFWSRFGEADPQRMGRLQQRGRLGKRPLAGQGMPDQPVNPPPQFRRSGLNENYSRELMELHTLGVDGGYTQQDVVEVARCFTGWTLRAPRFNPEFYFDARLHDDSPKTVLGKKIDAGGMNGAREVLDLLARHRNTAKFIATKLARRFVSDTPPQALVDRMARTFLETDGDIGALLQTMFYAPEFWSRQAYRAKIKKPFELVASAARALGAEVEVPLPLLMWTARIGEPLYLCQPPTGYSDKAEAWVNTGALLNRLNFALALAGGRIRGTQVDLDSLVGPEAADNPTLALARSIEIFLAGQVSPETRATLEKQMADPQVVRAALDDPVRHVDAGVIAGLVLGSPEFQRR